MYKNILDLKVKNKIKSKVLLIFKKGLKDITRKPNLFETWYIQTIKINRNIIKKHMKHIRIVYNWKHMTV